MLTRRSYCPDICARDGVGCGPSVKRLGLSECALGCSEAVTEALQSELLRAHLYPDGACSELRAVIARTYGITTDHVLVTNGADEALLLTALAFGGPDRTIAVPGQAFLGYRAVAELVRGRIVETTIKDYRHDWDSLAAAAQPGTLVFTCNPHNPTGTVLASRELIKLAELCRATNACLVVDEAYIEYSPDEPSSIALIDDYPCIVIRSLSKSHGLAGLRCGFAVGSPTAIEALLRLKHALPFSVNRLAAAAAIAALNDRDFTASVVQRIVSNRHWFCTRLNALGLPFPSSSANFVLVQVPVAGATAQKFLLEAGLLVKDATAMGFENHVRIGIGTLEDMQSAANALGALLSAHENHRLSAS